ncbi:MAG: ATP-binding cassette domain-containing protein, partial [Myxococcaceae bacterium]
MLELTSVRAGYPRRPVLDDVSLTLSAGRVLAVLGPNGAGKSTLVRVALGLHGIEAGTVRVAGKGLREWDRKALA